ncbi:TonB-dependent receptor, partial [Sphingomonas solaris]
VTPPETGDRANVLGGVTVTDTAIIDEGYKGEIKQTPKYVAPLLDTPRSIVVIPREVIAETGSTTLVEALRTVPGITFGAAEGGNPIGDRPFIRGFDSQGSTYLDGVRDIGAQSREIFAVEQVQVVRGPDGTLGGRGSAGGSLNIVSKLPTATDLIEATASYGNADYKRATLDVNRKISDMVAVRINAMWHDQDVAGRDAIFSRRWGVAPSVTIGIDSPTKLTLSYYHLHTDELPDAGIPYLYTIGNTPNLGYSRSEPAETFTTIGGVTGKVDRDTFYGLKDRDFRKTNVDQFTMRAEHSFGDITIRNTARYGHTDQGYIYTQPDDSQGNVYGTNAANPATAGGLVWRRANTRYSVTESFIDQADIYGTLKTGGIEHSFSAGAEASHEHAARGTYVGAGNVLNGTETLSTGATITPRCTAAAIARFYCTSAFTPNPDDAWRSTQGDASNVVVPVVRSAPGTRTINRATNVGAYAFDQVKFSEALQLNLGVRYDRYTSSVSPGLLSTATTGRIRLERADDLWNYQAGLVFKPTANTTLYVQHGTSATPPNALLGEGSEGNALPTTITAANLTLLDSLKIERTKSYEAGAKAELFDGGLALNVAVFDTRTKNARVTGPDNTVQFVGERRIRGVEFGYNGNITEAWKIFGGYSYLDAKIVDGGFPALTVAAVGARPATTALVPSVNTGRQFPQTAKHAFSTFTTFNFTPAFQIGGGAYYVSRVFGGYSDNRTATQNAAGVVTVNPATKILARSVPSYWRFDATASYKFTDAIDLRVNVQNLTDKRYYPQAFTTHYAAIAPGRTYYATLAFRY